MQVKIKIISNSDLCAASGDGFSSSIDTDVCCDKFGLPTIPSRRIKGCMRESAKLINLSDNTINAIFGESGKEECGSLKISDAYIENCEIVRSEIIKNNYDPQQVIQMFTNVRPSTKIENGTAAESSLRFTRVVNEISPITNQKMCYEAFAEIDSKYKADLIKICKALRNIGYNRNRGLGAVRCTVQEIPQPQNKVSYHMQDNKEYAITYLIKLKDALMMPLSKGSETAKYIPGTSVLGYFASQLKDNSDFENIFLKNNVKFSNLYISDKNAVQTIAAPSIICKEKDTGDLLNSIIEKNPHKKTRNPLKGGYVDENYVPKDIPTEIVYHHSTGEDSTLYTQMCICSDSYFKGTISGQGKYLKPIYSILASGRLLSFGRSKTAQYAKCTVEGNIKTEEIAPKTTAIQKGKQIIYLLDSDVLLIDEFGTYSLEKEVLYQALNVPYDKEAHKTSCDEHTALKYKTITGYNGKWNQKKPHIRAFAAGSCVVCTAPDNMQTESVFYIGEKQNEGFGKIMVYQADHIKPNKNAAKKANDIEQRNSSDSDIKALFSKNAQRESLRKKAVEYSKTICKEFRGFGTAFVGRLLLMVKESTDYDNLEKRVESIKTKSKKDKAVKVVKEAFNNTNNPIDKKDYKEFLTLAFTISKNKMKQENNGAKEGIE